MPAGKKEIDLHVELNYLKVTAQNDPIFIEKGPVTGLVKIIPPNQVKFCPL